MKKLTLALSFILGLFSISNTQAQMRIYNSNLVKFGDVNTSPTLSKGLEVVMDNFLFNGDSFKCLFGSNYLEISGKAWTGTLNAGDTPNGIIGGGGGVLPTTGVLTVIGPHKNWEIGSSSSKVKTVYAANFNYEKLTQSSDRRYKTNIVDLTPAMDKIMRLRPVMFDYRDGKDGERSTDPMRLNRVGLIAQELQEVIPEAVYYMEEDDIYTIDYTTFIPFLIKTVQEQQVLIENQQLQIEELQMALKLDNAAMVTPTFSSVKPGGNPAETMAVGNKLWSNVPNPFKQETRIRYALTEDVREAQLCIYDLSGKQLSCHRLNDRGESEFVLRAATLNPGIYLYSLIADGQVVDTHRMVVTE